MNRLLGYHRPFASIEEATACAARYLPTGHDHEDSPRIHLALSAKPRASDYPVLFYLSSILRSCRTIFDLGGNVGNVFYCYAQLIEFPKDLRWTVAEIPELCLHGAKLARMKGENRLGFTEKLSAADGADVYLASGSLHYFGEPLFEMIKRFNSKPAHIIINRTPLLETERSITVQDAGSYLVACHLYSKADLIKGFEAIGYELIDSWNAHERSLWIPLYPELSVSSYSGMYLRLQGVR